MKIFNRLYLICTICVTGIILMACTDTSKHQARPLIFDSSIIVTFSVANPLSIPYIDYTLGMLSLVATVELANGTELEIVLQGNQSSVLGIRQSVTPVPLLSAGSNHLFHGSYALPSGRLSSIRIAIAPNRSRIVINDQPTPLIDAYLNRYTSATDEQAGTMLTPRITPAEYEAFVTEPIILKAGLTHVIDLNVNINISHTLDIALDQPNDVNSALLIPVFSIIEPNRNEPLGLHFDQIGPVGFTDNTFSTGLNKVFTIPYQLTTDSILKKDGEPLPQLIDLEGLFYSQMITELDIMERQLRIDTLHMYALSVSEPQVLYQGKVTPKQDKLDIVGIRTELSPAGMSTFFNGSVNLQGGALLREEIIKPTDHRVILQGKEITSMIHPLRENRIKPASSIEKMEEQVLSITNSLFLPNDDLLSVQSATETSDTIKLVLARPIPCEFITNQKNSQSCEAIEVMYFPRANKGYYNYRITRQVNPATNHMERQDTGLQHQVLGDFFDDFAQLINQGYKLHHFIAQGEIQSTSFRIGKDIDCILLAPNKAVDLQTEGLIESEEGNTDPETRHSLSPAAISGIVAGAIALPLLTVTISLYALKHRKTNAKLTNNSTEKNIPINENNVNINSTFGSSQELVINTQLPSKDNPKTHAIFRYQNQEVHLAEVNVKERINIYGATIPAESIVITSDDIELNPGTGAYFIKSKPDIVLANATNETYLVKEEMGLLESAKYNRVVTIPKYIDSLKGPSGENIQANLIDLLRNYEANFLTQSSITRQRVNLTTNHKPAPIPIVKIEKYKNNMGSLTKQWKERQRIIQSKNPRAGTRKRLEDQSNITTSNDLIKTGISDTIEYQPIENNAINRDSFDGKIKNIIRSDKGIKVNSSSTIFRNNIRH